MSEYIHSTAFGQLKPFVSLKRRQYDKGISLISYVDSDNI